ncbi:hypothetical protein BJV78DRAFT_1181226 [Lactifluus subvellereus]|nr:hypothetical protein BJV78DRAFT_1181226 [Lactifluus subvellereus]
MDDSDDYPLCSIFVFRPLFLLTVILAAHAYPFPMVTTYCVWAPRPHLAAFSRCSYRI